MWCQSVNLVCVFHVWSVFLCRKLQIERQAVRQTGVSAATADCSGSALPAVSCPEQGTTGEKERQLKIYEDSQCLKMSVCVCIASNLGFWLGLRTQEIIRCSTWATVTYTDLCTTAWFSFLLFICRLRVYSFTLCSDFLTALKSH